MVIVLNGTSSSGKSSILEKFCDLSADLYCPFASDRMVCGSLSHKIDFENADHFRLVEAAYSSFNQSLAFYAANLPFMIVDHVLWREQSLQEVVQALRSVETFFVHVNAPLAIIEAREFRREDRKAGTARAQYDFIAKQEYDFTVDTNQMSPESAAHAIAANLMVGTALARRLPI